MVVVDAVVLDGGLGTQDVETCVIVVQVTKEGGWQRQDEGSIQVTMEGMDRKRVGAQRKP
jgi:hypothetical protein